MLRIQYISHRLRVTRNAIKVVLFFFSFSSADDVPRRPEAHDGAGWWPADAADPRAVLGHALPCVGDGRDGRWTRNTSLRRWTDSTGCTSVNKLVIIYTTINFTFHRIDQGFIGRFAPGSELARQRKGYESVQECVGDANVSVTEVGVAGWSCWAWSTHA